MKVVGVIGAGVMGVGVSQSLAEAGFDVVLIDLTDEVLARAHSDIKNNVRLYELLHKSERKQDVGVVLDRITFTRSYAPLAGADFVIENVIEKWDVKKQVYTALEQACPPSCVFAANTSAIPITRIASATQRPAQVIGMHFMNPVPLKKTVEVIKGYHTSAQTIATADELLRRMGKESILVNDAPGFVSNRVLMLTINEAICLVHDQVTTAEEVDRLFKNCFGHKMGPLETADLIGLDTILYSIEVLYECFADSKYRPSPLLKKMVDAGLYGRKSGRGFYSYQI